MNKAISPSICPSPRSAAMSTDVPPNLVSLDSMISMKELEYDEDYDDD